MYRTTFTCRIYIHILYALIRKFDRKPCKYLNNLCGVYIMRREARFYTHIGILACKYIQRIVYCIHYIHTYIFKNINGEIYRI